MKDRRRRLGSGVKGAGRTHAWLRAVSSILVVTTPFSASPYEIQSVVPSKPVHQRSSTRSASGCPPGEKPEEGKERVDARISCPC